jgi:hypothetical protein
MATAPRISVTRHQISPICFRNNPLHLNRSIEHIPEIMLVIAEIYTPDFYNLNEAPRIITQINKKLKTTTITHIEYLEMMNRFTKDGINYYKECVYQAKLAQEQPSPV